MDKMLKNSRKNIFEGGDKGRQNPLLGQKRRFWGPLSPPENIFFTTFQHIIHLCGPSAFQRAFARNFRLTFSRFMTFFVKLGFLVENKGI